MQDNKEKKSILSKMNKAPNTSASQEEFVQRQQATLRAKYAEKIIKHMIELTVWRDQMGTSMLTYIDKVLNQIYNIYHRGIQTMVAARTEYMEELQMILNDEKDMSEAHLYMRCEQMKELVDKVIANPSSNKELKQQVLDLLQVMRKPKLPDLTKITSAIKSSRPPRLHNKMRRMFTFRPKKSAAPTKQV